MAIEYASMCSLASAARTVHTFSLFDVSNQASAFPKIFLSARTPTSFEFRQVQRAERQVSGFGRVRQGVQQ
jgi:hypothetical protein